MITGFISKKNAARKPGDTKGPSVICVLNRINTIV